MFVIACLFVCGQGEWTMLMSACKGGEHEMAEWLIASGCNPLQVSTVSKVQRARARPTSFLQFTPQLLVHVLVDAPMNVLIFPLRHDFL